MPLPLALSRDVLSRASKEGPRTLLRQLPRAVRAALRPREERLIVLMKDLDRIAEQPVETKVRLEPLERRHLPALYDLNRRRCETRADRRFARDLDRGYHGYVGFVDDDVVGYYWWVDVSASPRHPDLDRYGLGIELDGEDVYGSDFYILAEHRGGGNAGAFLHELETDLRRRGYRRLWGYVASTNRPARWIYSLRGYEPMWTVLRKTAPLRRQRTERVFD